MKEAHQIEENISNEMSTILETKSNETNIQMTFQRQLRSKKNTDSATNIIIN